MGWNQVKRDPADIAFSKYVRSSSGWKCARCGNQFPQNAANLHAAHFHARRKESVRFDMENVDALCAGCHRYFTNHYTEHKQWKLEQMGQEKYDLLMLRANMRGEKNRKAEALYWRQALKADYP